MNFLMKCPCDVTTGWQQQLSLYYSLLEKEGEAAEPSSGLRSSQLKESKFLSEISSIPATTLGGNLLERKREFPCWVSNSSLNLAHGPALLWAGSLCSLRAEPAGKGRRGQWALWAAQPPNCPAVPCVL